MPGLQHSLTLNKNLDQRARERFTSSMRAWVLTDLAGQMQADYEQASTDAGESHCSGEAVHQFLKNRGLFKWYSSLRCATQELVWQSVLRAIESDPDSVEKIGTAAPPEQGGSLALDDTIALPDYIDTMDVHLMPGNYQGGHSDGAEAGVVYDNGLDVFSFGVMGENLDDIGHSMANFTRLKWPELNPKLIVDVGCTIGHNTVPWKQTFPEAEVHGLDAASPCLKYGHARAEAMGVPIAFKQALCDALPYSDSSVDVVFSSMFLHELPTPFIKAFFNEAYRVLKPGGVLINMELPPNDALGAYAAFYLDWDCFYNNEPFYKDFRDLSYSGLCSDAGFAEQDFFQATMPRFTYVSEAEFARASGADATFDADTGRLSDTITWYAFGAQKSGASR
ncbi:MAG: class I SAM-dependent methyltransferase [Luminiphilus sp.]|nr:class I SAM-dependent methyltransferase [Luminiphilus sp.]MBL6820964.1 class I SAM-dependent methyltransferase [Luminiphilus sp.]